MESMRPAPVSRTGTERWLCPVEDIARATGWLPLPRCRQRVHIVPGVDTSPECTGRACVCHAIALRPEYAAPRKSTPSAPSRVHQTSRAGLGFPADFARDGAFACRLVAEQRSAARSENVIQTSLRPPESMMRSHSVAEGESGWLSQGLSGPLRRDIAERGVPLRDRDVFGTTALHLRYPGGRPARRRSDLPVVHIYRTANACCTPGPAGVRRYRT